MMIARLTAFFVFGLMLFISPATQAQEEETASTDSMPVSALAMHGKPKYGPDFTHLDYTNPNASKGGTIRLHAVGTFDSLNPFIVKGTSAAGLSFLGQTYLYDSLMEQSNDEAFSMYCLLCETVEMAMDRSWIAFNLRPEAKWHDGKPITADDVVWTFNTVMEKGSPFFKAYYGDVVDVEAESPSRVKFTFRNGENMELPLILSQLSILPRHYWQVDGREFGETTLEPPLGSGPYKISKVDPGRSIDYERVPDYWGKDIPINRGRFNFDHIIYDYYRESNVALEAFFAGEYDFREENTAKLWATAYDVPPVKEGRIIKELIHNERPQGIQGFIYNVRRPVFQDKAVRKALAYAFDFEWSNKQFAYGTYSRSDSYFENSDLAALPGSPEGRVLEILEQFKDRLPEDLFTGRYEPPETDGSGKNRKGLRAAMKTLDDAGYKLVDGVRTHEKTGQKLEFEILAVNPEFERWILPFVQNLEKIGVKAKLRFADTAQYQNRMNNFDYDMTIMSFGQSSSPGNEQRDFWSSAKADMVGSRNYIGIKDPIVDELIEMIIAAPDREELVYRCRALDRVLLSGYYLIPQWHLPAWRLAWWNKFEHPEIFSKYTPGVTTTWWAKENR